MFARDYGPVSPEQFRRRRDIVDALMLRPVTALLRIFGQGLATPGGVMAGKRVDQRGRAPRIPSGAPSATSSALGPQPLLPRGVAERILSPKPSPAGSTSAASAARRRSPSSSGG